MLGNVVLGGENGCVRNAMLVRMVVCWEWIVGEVVFWRMYCWVVRIVVCQECSIGENGGVLGM